MAALKGEYRGNIPPSRPGDEQSPAKETLSFFGHLEDASKDEADMNQHSVSAQKSKKAKRGPSALMKAFPVKERTLPAEYKAILTMSAADKRVAPVAKKKAG